MKKTHTKKPPSQVVPSVKAAARKLAVTARTVRNWRAEGCPGFDTDGTIDLALVAPWAEARLKTREGASNFKDEKTIEEIRKLRLANDARESRLVERAWVAERIQRMAGELNSHRVKSEAEHPMKFAAAAGDVPACRSIVRGVWDDIMSSIQSLHKHLREGTP